MHPGIGRDQHGVGHVGQAHALGRGVELRRQLEVPREIGREHVRPPLIVGDRERSSSSSAHDRWTWTATGLRSPPPSRNASITPEEVDRPVDRDQAVGPAAHRSRLLAHRRAVQGGDPLRQAPHARPVDAHEPVVADLLAAEEGADHVHALEEPRVRVVLSGQRSPVTCSFSASPDPSAAQNRPGNRSPSVAIDWATSAGW